MKTLKVRLCHRGIVNVSVDAPAELMISQMALYSLSYSNTVRVPQQPKLNDWFSDKLTESATGRQP